MAQPERPLHPTIPELALGETEVWYYKNGRDLGMGFKFCRKEGLLPDPSDLTKTHVLLGKVASKDCEHLFEMLQGENWGQGEVSNELLKSKGLYHTSMSIGDILVIDGTIWFCDRLGFVELKPGGVL